MIVSSPSVVLKRFPYGETSIIARCFTRQMGKLGLMVRGARGPRKKSGSLAAYFQPLSFLDLTFYHKPSRSLQTVSKASFSATWPHIHNHLKNITYSLAVVELTDRTITEEDPHPELFDELVQVLRCYNSRDHRLNLIFWHYQLRLLTLLGFKPDLDLATLQGVSLPDPGGAPNSRELLANLLAGRLVDDRFLNWLETCSLTARDRRVINAYLRTHLQIHFEGFQDLQSLKVLGQVLP